MMTENIENVPILNIKVSVQKCRKSLNDTRHLTPGPRNRNFSSVDFKSLGEKQPNFDSDKEICATARLESSLGTRSAVVSRDRLRTSKKEIESEDLSNLIQKSHPNNPNVLIQPSQSYACFKNPLREQILSLYGAEKESSKSYDTKKRQTSVPYVINRQELKKLPPQIIDRAGSSYRNMSERNRFERNSIEINKLRLSLGKDEARDRATCLSFMQKYTHETFDQEQVSSFINFIQRQDPISPSKTMKDLITESKFYIETLKSNTAHHSSSRCYSSTSRIIHKDVSRYSSQPKLSSKISSLRTNQLNVHMLKRYLVFRLGTPWEITHFPYNDTLKRNSLLLENVMLQRLHKKSQSKY